MAGADAGAQEKALAEFDGFVAALREAGVDIPSGAGYSGAHTPDSIFPQQLGLLSRRRQPGDVPDVCRQPPAGAKPEYS